MFLDKIAFYLWLGSHDWLTLRTEELFSFAKYQVFDIKRFFTRYLPVSGFDPTPKHSLYVSIVTFK